MKFKVGDKVQLKREFTGSDNDVCDEFNKNPIQTITLLTGNRVSYGGCEHTTINLEHVELINQSNMIQDIKESFKLAFMKEPEKSFRKAGITNGDDFLTDDGEKVFLGWLLKQNSAAFKTDVVDALLAEQEKNS